MDYKAEGSVFFKMFRRILVSARWRLSNTSRRGITLHLHYHCSENLISRPTRLKKNAAIERSEIQLQMSTIEISPFLCQNMRMLYFARWFGIDFLKNSFSPSTCMRSYKRNRKRDAACLLEQNY